MRVKHIVVVFFICTVVSLIGVGAFYRSFEHALVVGDWNRIPLWFPYEVVDFEYGYGRVHDWTCWDKGEDAVTLDPDSDPESVSLAFFDAITEFSIQGNNMIGKREIRKLGRSFSQGLVYFIFSKGEDRPQYFKTEEGFLRSCERIGVDPSKMDSFDRHFKKHCQNQENLFFFEKVVKGYALLFKSFHQREVFN